MKCKHNFKKNVKKTPTNTCKHSEFCYRVSNLAQNSEAFSEAYSCGRGTQMNPEFKCNAFPELKDVDSYNSELAPH
jgi:hypothetical protein